MRGSPLLHLLVCAAAFALFAVPLAKLTIARPQAFAAKAVTVGANQSATLRHALIRVRYAHVPQSLSLKLDGKELLTVPDQKSQSLEIETNLPLSKYGIEFALTARWPAGTPGTAVTVEVEPDELDARRETRWSDSGSMDEILSFSW